VAKSIERIHTANLINFGIVPLVFENAADYDPIEQGDELEINGIREAIASGAGRVAIRNVTKGLDVWVKVNLSQRQRGIILAGGLLNFTKEGVRKP
jgi:aconitate hydratase